jgi:hypothetical protein
LELIDCFLITNIPARYCTGYLGDIGVRPFGKVSDRCPTHCTKRGDAR